MSNWDQAVKAAGTSLVDSGRRDKMTCRAWLCTISQLARSSLNRSSRPSASTFRRYEHGVAAADAFHAALLEAIVPCATTSLGDVSLQTLCPCRIVCDSEAGPYTDMKERNLGNRGPIREGWPQRTSPGFVVAALAQFLEGSICRVKMQVLGRAMQSLWDLSPRT